MKFTLKCPEGWTYISWQRVSLTHDGHQRYNTGAVEALENLFDGSDDESDKIYLSCEHDWFFVLSGESFTMQDFAESLQEALDIKYPDSAPHEVICEDG